MEKISYRGFFHLLYFFADNKRIKKRNNDNNFSMYYVAIALIIVLIGFIFYRVLGFKNEPDFLLKELLTDDALKFSIISQAMSSQKTTPFGKGLSLRLIKRYTNICFKCIRNEIAINDSFEFENRIYDNFYILRERISQLKTQIRRFQFLPHVNDLPRIYNFCSHLVKSTKGVINAEILKRMVDEYNAVTPLTYNEIKYLPMCLTYALLEFLTIFCSKTAQICKGKNSARLDAKRNRVNLSLINKNSYIYFFTKFANSKLNNAFKSVLEKNDIFYAEKNEAFIHLISSYNASIESAFSSLLNIDSFLTDEYLIELSPLHQLLKNEKIVYENCTLPTKNVYLFHIARRAKKMKIGELAYARGLVEKSVNSKEDIAKYILPKPASNKLMKGYIFLVALVSIISSLPPLFFIKPLYVSIPISVLLFPSSLAVTLMLASELNAKFAFRRYLPRIKLNNNYNSETLIIYCGLICKKEEIADLFFNIQTVRYANPNKIFKYGLLLDFPKGEENCQTDDELMEECKRQFFNLSEKDKFNVFIRKRKKIEGENSYQGYEKKRGAIIELNSYILSGNDEDFKLILGEKPNVKYVITLDTDTMLNSALELVEIMEHSFNQNKCIVSLSTKSNPYSVNTMYSRLFGGDFGLSNYNHLSQDINYDLFDSGNYTGKGIYRVREFNEKLKDFFPDNRLLSHDFIEGAVAGCSCSEYAIDCYPSTFSSSLFRNVRWLRGDWQLLPYLSKKIKDRDCNKCVNPITPIAKWHIFCNLIFSLIPITLLVSIIISFFSVNPLMTFLFSSSYIISMIFNSVRGSILKLKNPLPSFLKILFYFATIPIIAYYYFTAILITICRLITKKKLLEWKVFAHFKQRINALPVIIVSTILTLAVIFLNKNLYLLIIPSVFILSLPAILILNYRFKNRRYLPDKLKISLLDLSQKTWKYFEEIKTPLIPDNLQLHLDLGYANRTSPTNIGFSLLAPFCAFSLGFISKNQMQKRIEAIISEIEKLEKWHGNLYNWFDLSGNLLYPKYVSSVDNGNLLASLLVLLSVFENDLSIKQRVQNLIDNMQIEKLYDENRGLLYIGYNESEAKFDSHYDLLASESMLTYLLAIGTGKIDKKSFYNLNKNALRAYGKKCLASWSGGMFEYLMSSIFVCYPSFSMLNKSALNVINAHKKDKKFLFWGASESQYNSTDNIGNYQYKAFGVNAIANSNSYSSRVKTPYASILALRFMPKAVQKNIAKMKQGLMEGEYGFFESIDEGIVIKSYMSHHQGMILTSLTNYLCSDIIIESLKKQPSIAAAQILLTINNFDSITKKKKIQKLRKIVSSEEVFAKPTHKNRLNFLSNGSYKIINSNNGFSQSAFKDLCISRNEIDSNGFKIFLNLDREFNSLDDCIDLSLKGAYFNNYKTVYPYLEKDFIINQTCMVLPNLDGEMRNISIKNLSENIKEFELITYFEPSLAYKRDDIGHKTFSDMKMRILKEDDMLLAYRVDSKKPMFLGHYLSDSENNILTTNKHNLFFNTKMRDSISPLYPILSIRKRIVLQPKKQTDITAFILLSNDIEQLKKQAKITKGSSYLRQIEANNFSFSKHFGLDRLSSDLGSSILCSRFLKMQGFLNLPTVLLKVKHKTHKLRQEIANLSKLQKFIDFNVVICYESFDGYFHRELDEITPLKELKNVHLLNYFTEKEKIEKIEKFAVKSVDFLEKEEFKNNNFIAYKNAVLNKEKYDFKLNDCGFLCDSSFMMELKEDNLRPWSNVISNGKIGTVITESGTSYTFYKNSYLNKISRWTNDPIKNKVSEAIILAENGIQFSATRKPIKTDSEYIAIHSFGYTQFINNFNGLISTQTEFIDLNTTKFFTLRLENKTKEQRQIEAHLYIDLVLGIIKEETHGFIYDEREGESIKAYNIENNQKIYINCSEKITKYENENAKLRVYAIIDLQPDSTKEIVFTLGVENIYDSPDLLTKSKIIKQECINHFKNLTKIKINLSDKKMYHLLNWLPYQCYSSRFNAKGAFYQAGGAIGFRDQLQDCLSLLYIDREMVRNHILLCAKHQFKEGDVQHWWHESALGVRTLISDDFLYLPYLTAEYINFTSDNSILSENIPYLSGKTLLPNQKDSYFEALENGSGSLYEHCIKALKYSKINPDNNLVLIGGGDWNDAMDNIGIRGEGTSVFLSMFLYFVTDKFLPFIKDNQLRNELIKRQNILREGVDKAYDGQWFLRAITDDGLILGSKNSKECKIDLLSQSWAKLSNISDKNKTKTALKSVADNLIDFENGVIKLLSPPFENVNAGYISKYPLGIRENGGQYTHASIWYIMALIAEGSIDFAYSLLEMVNPVNHCDTKEKMRNYMTEPYVLCGDVYAGDFIGQGGWSWYTGASSWYYKCFIEEVCGIKTKGNLIYFNPNLPQKIDKIDIEYKTDLGLLKITIDNGLKSGDYTIIIDNIKYNLNYIKISESIINKKILIKRLQ